MGDIFAYGGLFLSALIAATVLPSQSEIVLIGLLVSGAYSTFWLLFVASLGNVLGSVSNYWIGRWAVSYQDRKWFPVKKESLQRAEQWFERYGRWTLLLCWVPLIGDPITVAAGAMGEKFWRFLPIVIIAKTGRYLVVAALTLNWLA